MLALLCSLSELMYVGRVACTGDLAVRRPLLSRNQVTAEDESCSSLRWAKAARGIFTV